MFVCFKKDPEWSQQKKKALQNPCSTGVSMVTQPSLCLRDPKASVQTVAAPQRPFDFSTQKTHMWSSRSCVCVCVLYYYSFPNRHRLTNMNTNRWLQTGFLALEQELSPLLRSSLSVHTGEEESQQHGSSEHDIISIHHSLRCTGDYHAKNVQSQVVSSAAALIFVAVLNTWGNYAWG